MQQSLWHNIEICRIKFVLNQRRAYRRNLKAIASGSWKFSTDFAEAIMAKKKISHLYLFDKRCLGKVLIFRRLA